MLITYFLFTFRVEYQIVMSVVMRNFSHLTLSLFLVNFSYIIN